MKKAFTAFSADKRQYMQFAMVFAAFLIMVLISSAFGANIVSKNIAATGNEVVRTAGETITAYLDEYKLTLEDLAFLLERHKQDGASPSDIEEEIAQWSNWLLEGGSSRFGTFNGIYGVVDGVYIDGTYWRPPEGYVAESRPWYVGAVKKDGAVFFTDPYIDAQTGEFVLTASRQMFDENGEPFGVIAVDLFISSITEFVGELNLLDQGYGLLLDSNRGLVVVQDSGLIGTRIDDVNGGEGGYATIGSMLADGERVSAFTYAAHSGVKSVAFFEKLENDWYVGVISPLSAYNSDVQTMIIFLSAAGMILMGALCAILAALHVEKKRSEDANRIKTSFLANMSHEIRTPMNAIIGMTELLANEPLSERQEGYVKDINNSSHNLLGIINDILDLSKIESGKLELAPVDFDFQAFIDNISSMFCYVSQKKGVDFVFEERGEIPRYLFCDDIRLRQVLTNICGNAVKFTSEGEVSLTVTGSEDSLEFEVMDTGLGIRKEDLPRLFDPFEQADALKNRGKVGTGLGLAISKNFVELMGGTIKADSVYGQGTVFTITIPLIPGDGNNVRYDSEKHRENSFTASSARILVVDDNEVNLKVALGLLGLFGIDAESALSGAEAIDLVQKTDYDIVFMDHMMPEMDGIEATAEIRKLGGKFEKLTIIALTANAIYGARAMFLESGFDDFLTKPIEISEMADALRQWIPKDLIEAAVSVSAEESAGDSEFLARVREIGEIDVNTGMNRVSGAESVYRETLEMFYEKLLSDRAAMEGHLEAGDLRGFAITVHGIKSTLATVGAMELSRMAAELEEASKNGNAAFCEERFPGLSEGLYDLHTKLSNVFGESAVTSVKPEGDPKLLSEKVKAAIAAAEDFDNILGIEILSETVVFYYGEPVNALLEKALSAFKDYDYDIAEEHLRAIDVS